MITKVIAKPMEITKGRSILFDGRLGPEVHVVNHAHSFQHKKADVGHQAMKLSS
jgi:hypothetical protein